MAPRTFNPEDWKLFVELPYFIAKWRSLGLVDEDLRALQLLLTAQPEHGPIVQGTGGLRKIRFRGHDSNIGKSGAFRIGYVYFKEYSVIGLIAVFAKRDQGNFTPDQRMQIKKILSSFKDWVARGGK